MTSNKRLKLTLTFAAVAMATLALTTTSAHAQLEGELGILDLSANGGVNPATMAPWQAGDTYRFIFASSAGRDATSANINDYNNFVQGLANASTVGGPGTLASVNWRAMGSTETVDARDNTNTNINLDGTGESFWLLNGTSLVADDYADLYGSATHSNPINVSETGGAPLDTGDFTSLWTGSAGDGTAKVSPGIFGGDNWLGSTDGGTQGVGPTSLTGLWNFTSGAHWIDRFSLPNNVERGFYGVSDPLTVFDPNAATVPEPASIALWSLLGLGLAGFGYYRSRRKK